MKTFIQSLTFLIVSSFCLTHTSFAQQGQLQRITEIKKMYAQANQLQSKTKKSCSTGSKIIKEGFDNTSEKFPFTQHAKICTLANNYTIYTGLFSGYEWGSTYEIYQENKKTFFVFIQSNAEACGEELRVYYSATGTILQILKKSNECNGDKPSIESKVTDATEIAKIDQDIKNRLNEIRLMAVKKSNRVK